MLDPSSTNYKVLKWLFWCSAASEIKALVLMSCACIKAVTGMLQLCARAALFRSVHYLLETWPGLNGVLLPLTWSFCCSLRDLLGFCFWNVPNQANYSYLEILSNSFSAETKCSFPGHAGLKVHLTFVILSLKQQRIIILLVFIDFITQLTASPTFLLPMWVSPNMNSILVKRTKQWFFLSLSSSVIIIRLVK